MIVSNYVTRGLNVEEVGDRMERPERPKAHSIGQHPMYKAVTIFAL
jgi:hypothetical protein